MAVKQSLQRIPFFLALLVPFALIVGRGIADGIMVVLALGFLAQSFKNNDWSWIKKPWVQLALLTWVYLFISASMAEYDTKGAYERAAEWIRFPVFSLAFSHWILPQEKNRKILDIYLIVLLAAVCIDTICQYSFGKSLSGVVKPTYPGRLSGPFHNKLVVGIYLTRLAWPAIGGVFFLFLSQNNFLKRFAPPVLFLALLAVTVLLSGERVALGLFCFAGLFFWCGAQQYRKPLFICGVLGVGLLLALSWVKPDLHERFINNSAAIASESGNSTYAKVFSNAMIEWKTAPFFGVGPKNYLAVCDALAGKGDLKETEQGLMHHGCALHPHNLYLEWLTETGVIGLVLFCGLVVLWSIEAWQNLRHAGYDYFRQLGYAVGLVPFLWPLMTSMSFFSNWSAILFWWVLGLALYGNRPMRRDF